MSAGMLLFAFGLGLSWTNSAMHIVLSDRPLYGMGAHIVDTPVRWPRGVFVGILSALFAGLVVLFVRGWHPEWVAVVILVSMFALRRWEVAQWPDEIVVRLGKYVSAAACLSGWLVAQAVLRLLGYPVEQAQALGWNAGCGVMAGAMTLAGITKLREVGPRWMEARHQALLVAERAFTGPWVLRRVRWAVAQSPVLTRGMGVYGMVVELAAILFVVPEARVLVLGAIWALLAGFVILLGYIEVEWAVVALAVVLLAG